MFQGRGAGGGQEDAAAVCNARVCGEAEEVSSVGGGGRPSVALLHGPAPRLSARTAPGGNQGSQVLGRFRIHAGTWKPAVMKLIFSIDSFISH